MRQIIDFNKNWIFSEKECEGGKTFSDTPVTLPFFHSIASMPEGSFKTSWPGRDKDEGKTVYIEFTQLSAYVKVFTGEKLICEHAPSATPFRALLTLEAVKNETYEIEVAVKPSARADGKFCFAGVNLITVGSSHFNILCPGDGISVRTEKDGRISIKTDIVRPNNYDVVSYTVYGMKNDEIISSTAKPTSPDTVITLDSPEIWDGQSGAYFYTLNARLLRDSGVLDEVNIPFGFRETALREDGFFYLNSFRLPLDGTRLTDLSSVKSDLQNLKTLDTNALIASSLPSKTDLLSFTDREGIVFWYEMSHTGSIIEDKNALKDFLLINASHPSLTFIVCPKEADSGYFNEISSLVNEYAPHLITVFSLSADDISKGIPDEAQLTLFLLPFDSTPEGYIAGTGRFSDLQEKYPEKLFALYTESPLRTQMTPPEALRHNIRLWNSFSRRKNIIAYFPGVLSDGKETGSLRGLTGFDRTVIYDSFSFFKAQFSPDGFISIVQPEEYETNLKTIDIECITNRENLRILVNGKDKKYTAEKVTDGLFVFRQVKLKKDENLIEVSAEDECDSIQIFRY